MNTLTHEEARRVLEECLGFFAWLDAAATEPEMDRRIRELSRWLDRLCQFGWCFEAIAHSNVEAFNEETYLERYNNWRERFRSLLPTLSWYWEVGNPTFDPTQPNPTPAAGDAHDDLADICLEIERVHKVASAIGPVEAVGFFAWSFKAHWGRHARDLQSYLHGVLTCGG